MSIISFLNQKGGVGKSTLAINVGAYLAMMGRRVLLIDADKQETATAWKSLRPEGDKLFTVVSMSRENMAQEVMELASGYDITVIDGPPQAETISRSCIVASDLVVIPMEPGGFSKWSSEVTIQQLQQAMEFKPTLKCGFVVSRKIHGTVLGRHARLNAAESGISVFDTEIENRIPVTESGTMGKTIYEYAPNSPAVREFQALTTEILEIVDEHQKLRANAKTTSKRRTVR